MKILIDDREHELIKLAQYYLDTNISYKDVQIVIEHLPLGDIIIQENNTTRLIIERKSLADLASSIKDGRYNEQSYRLTHLEHHNHNIIYLIEGDLNKFNTFRDKMDKNTLYSAMFSLNYLKGFSLLRSMDIAETAHIICNMAYKLGRTDLNQREGFFGSRINDTNNINNINDTPHTPEVIGNASSNKSYCDVIKKTKKEHITTENIGEIMLCQIPGVSVGTAIAIMTQYSTISNLIKVVTNDISVLNTISITNSKGHSRKITKPAIANIISYLHITPITGQSDNNNTVVCI